MRFTYLLLVALAVVSVGILGSTKGKPSSERCCHSSLFLPLDPLASVEVYAQAVKSDPLSAEAHRELGAAYLSLFDTSAEAEREFREAVRLDPSSPAGYTGLGWSYLRLNSIAMSARVNGRFRDPDAKPRVALDLFEQALSIDPVDASARLGCAQSYRLLGVNKEAEAECRAALASCRDSGEAWDLLGDVLTDLRRYDEAIDAYEHEIEISTAGTTTESLSPRYNRGRGDPFWLYLWVGDILFDLHRTEEAIVHYEKGLAISGDSSTSHQRLALAYYQLGQYDKYESHLEALRDGCSRTENIADWCHFYRDVVDRMSLYRFNPDMLFRVTNLDVTVTAR